MTQGKVEKGLEGMNKEKEIRREMRKDEKETMEEYKGRKNKK